MNPSNFFLGYGFSPEAREAEWRELEGNLPAKRSDCPLTAEFLELAAGQAFPEEEARLKDHLSTCDSCRTRFQFQQRAVRRAEELRARAPGVSLLAQTAAELKEHLSTAVGRQDVGSTTSATVASGITAEAGGSVASSEGGQEWANALSKVVGPGTTLSGDDASRKNFLKMLDTLEIMVFGLCRNRYSWEEIGKMVKKSPEDFLEEVVCGISWARNAFGGRPPTALAVTDETAGAERPNLA